MKNKKNKEDFCGIFIVGPLFLFIFLGLPLILFSIGTPFLKFAFGYVFFIMFALFMPYFLCKLGI